MTSMLASILKWSLTQGQAEDATAASNAPPMSDADRAWLKEALESVMVNAVKRIKQLVVVISLPESEEGISGLLTQHGTASAAAQAKQNEASKKSNAANGAIPSAVSSSSSSSSTASARTSSAPASSSSSSAASSSSLPLPNSGVRPLPLGLPPSETIYTPQPSSSSTLSSPTPSAIPSSSPVAASPPPSAELLLKSHMEILAMKRAALEELEELVSHLDHADDFVSIGGLPHLLTLFHSNDAAMRWRAAAVLSTLIDNHQKTADAALKVKALEQVIRLLQPPVSSASSSSATASAAAAADTATPSTSDEWLCVAKCLGCLSAFLRSETKAAEVFLTLHGPVRVAALLSHSPPAAVLRKTFSVLRLCLSKFPSTAALFVPSAPSSSTTAPLLSYCPSALRSTDLNVREECARFLARLCASPALANSVGDDVLGIRTAVNGRLKAVEAADAEERESLEDERQALAEVARLCHF